MSKKFKKHTFIPWEKIAKKLGTDEIHLHLFLSQREAKEKNQGRNRLNINTDKIVEVGYGQYAMVNYDYLYFDFQYKNNKGIDEKLNDSSWTPLNFLDYSFKNINMPLPYFFNWYYNQGLAPIDVTVKPIYKLVNPHTKEPYIGDPALMPSGTYDAHFIGMLVKQKGNNNNA